MVAEFRAALGRGGREGARESRGEMCYMLPVVALTVTVTVRWQPTWRAWSSSESPADSDVVHPSLAAASYSVTVASAPQAECGSHGHSGPRRLWPAGDQAQAGPACQWENSNNDLNWLGPDPQLVPGSSSESTEL